MSFFKSLAQWPFLALLLSKGESSYADVMNVTASCTFLETWTIEAKVNKLVDITNVVFSPQFNPSKKISLEI